MSKKSRKRNKKILGALAAGLGAMALMKRGVPAAANVDSGRGSGLRDTVDSAKNWITKKASNVADTTGSYLGKMTGHGPQEGSVGQKIRAAHAAAAMAPKGINHPLHNPTRIRTHSIRGMKSGGRVTGIAKRGFGRALMKGKK